MSLETRLRARLATADANLNEAYTEVGIAFVQDAGAIRISALKQRAVVLLAERSNIKTTLFTIAKVGGFADETTEPAA